MTTTHEVPPVEGKLKTVVQFVTQVPSLLSDNAQVAISANATIMSNTTDGELDGRIFFAVGGNKCELSALEAAALIKGLLEHMGHRAELNHGGDAVQAFTSSIRVAEAIVNDSVLPENEGGAK